MEKLIKFIYRFAFILVLLPAVTVSAGRGNTGKSAVLIGRRPPQQWRKALSDAGYVMVRDRNQAQLYIVNNFSGRDAEMLKNAVKRGAGIVFGIRKGVNLNPTFKGIMPVNNWPFKTNRLRRDAAGIIPFPNSGFQLDRPLYISSRFDMHLPWAPIENSMHRYQPKEYGHSIDQTDWKVLLTVDSGGKMPILVSGRVGPATILCFGGDLYNPELSKSPGYAEFCRSVIAAATPAPISVPASSPNLSLSIPRYQPDGLLVTVTNKSLKTEQAVLSYQIACPTREILNRSSIPIKIGPGQTTEINLKERSLFKGDPNITEATAAAMPWRYIRVGLLSPDRKKIISEEERLVLTAPVLNIKVREDASNWDKKDDWYRSKVSYDGNTGGRYIYPVGTCPQITVNVSNGLLNLAPLAMASDLVNPGNKTINGLNDLSLSHASARTKDGRLTGMWCGKTAPSQKLQLTWQKPVMIAGIEIEGFGPYRRQNQLNPRNFSLSGDNNPFKQLSEAEYEINGSDLYSRLQTSFTPQKIKCLDLNIDKLNVRIKQRVVLSGLNCAIRELKVYGWPGKKLPPTVNATLKVVACDLLKNTRTEVFSSNINLHPLSSLSKKIKLPARKSNGPVRYEISVASGARTVASKQYDVFFVAPNGSRLIDKHKFGAAGVGLLCTPGWVYRDSFGKGMRDWTQGWGGPHDKIWANTNGLMEINWKKMDRPERMMTSAVRFSHYTNPWREFPDGTYSWDWVREKLLKDMQHGRLGRKGKSLLVVGSDRWNGVPIGAGFGWDNFIRFDQYLRTENGTGLKGRSRKQIINEIRTIYARQWQEWMLNRYADKMLETQKMFAKNGIGFVYETHGSFPLAGGEVAKKLGKTHLGVGTDLFWELWAQDLYLSIGRRFGLVAVNPDLRSGMYNQWGWVNTESNKFWFANNGSIEPARRQWYATYFAGRVDSKGSFNPYHVMGFSAQGGVSTKFYEPEIAAYAKTCNFTVNIRPEQPCGFGLAVSWNSQKERMKSKAGAMGFGLYAAGNRDQQIDTRMGELYSKLVKNGLPVSFVTSTTALQHWRGSNPLVIFDAGNWSAKDFEAIKRLNENGTAIIAFAESKLNPAAAKFFSGMTAKQTANGIKYKIRHHGGAPVVLIDEPSGPHLRELVNMILTVTGMPLDTSTHLPVTTFISRDALFLAFGDQSDHNRVETVTVAPAAYYPALKGKKLAFIDMDRNKRITVREIKPGLYSFQLPFPATSGRMVMIKATE